MNYLSATDYEAFGLEATTPAAWVTAASAAMDGHCRRPSLGVCQYTERLRVAEGRNAVRLTYLPVVRIVSGQVRYANPRRGGQLPVGTADFGAAVAQAFGLPGMWAAIDVTGLDLCADTGEVTLPINALGLTFNEVELVYEAGVEAVPDTVKAACAQIVRNALATPALNVRCGTLDRVHMEYFADSLLDASVRAMLAPYVAQRVG